ncbi:universal stress protein [Novosphingobium humi]|uniref:Universal stress protein n=1 Tax=Novosphingobium humi TaxID=2282397 RepID=A0ABY7U1G3_9SPHN|nr:universal stress protein [Novosphingobium humi]WCT78596.1 universal stress protein [Novosphingobium humi]WJS97796.1 universal stress protein [Novosphingobium humi]
MALQSNQGFVLPTPPESPVIAFVDGSRRSRDVVLAAADFARSCMRPLILFHAMPEPVDLSAIPDPLAWSIRRQEARKDLARWRDMLPQLPGAVSLELSEGDWLSALGSRACEAGALTVIGSPHADEYCDAAGQAAKLIAGTQLGSVLLVPSGYTSREVMMRRIAVPIDGSNYAEAALAEAVRLARKSQAELLLVHVVPDAALTEFGPLATGDLELRKRLEERNEKAACGFMETTRRRLIDQGLVARVLCKKGDTRSTLLKVLSEQEPDLVVISAKGQGGRHCSDLSIGGTASYLLDHLACPVMLVRPPRLSGARSHAQQHAGSPGLRSPVIRHLA